MQRSTIEHIFARNRELLPRKYAQLPAGGDIHLTAGFIIEGDNPPETLSVATLPHLPKEELVDVIRMLLQAAESDPPPEPIAGVVVIAPGYRLDNDTHERIGELVTIEVEAADGQLGMQLFEVKREPGKNTLTLMSEEIFDQDLRSESELGNLQGFYPRKSTPTRH